VKSILGWIVLRRILLGGVILLVALQFLPVERTNPVVESEVPAPANVRDALRRACYDCHSNETVWPWYSRVAPLSFLIARDVRAGREELNFSTWNRIATKQQVKKLKESWENVAEGEMPPWFYLPMHRDAALSTEDRAALRAWAMQGTSAAASDVDSGKDADGAEEGIDD
jgi:heme-binding protein